MYNEEVRARMYLVVDYDVPAGVWHEDEDIAKMEEEVLSANSLYDAIVKAGDIRQVRIEIIEDTRPIKGQLSW